MPNIKDYLKDFEMTVVVDDAPSKDASLKAKHGFSVHLSLEGHHTNRSLMFDSGPSPEVLAHNSEHLGINMEKVELAVLSHGHYDHGGGLSHLLQKAVNKPLPVIVHPSAFETKLSFLPHLRYIGLPFDIAQLRMMGGVPIMVKDAIEVMDGVLTTGEVPRAHNNPSNLMRVTNGTITDDPLMDDISLIMVTEKGIIVLCGCAHAGVMNIVERAMELTGKKVIALVGGLHLSLESDERIFSVVEYLGEVGINTVAPAHCTGRRAVDIMSKELDAEILPISVGTRFYLDELVS